MAASSLLALIDDISALLDDIAVLTKVAASKTAGVMGDDLALNAEQVSGVRVERELPVVWAVAKGSLLNKLILVPAALAISAFLPAAIQPLLMIGGLFLCYEGFEKVAHKILHKPTDGKQKDTATAAVVKDASPDLVAFERDKVKGAIRTDFVLSAEIIVITLGTMAAAPLLQTVLALSAVGFGATVLVYGLVAGIVKIDNLGLAMHNSGNALNRTIGDGILRAAPVLMKTLSVVGTFAMFAVGGGILMHGLPFVEHIVEPVLHALEPAAAIVKSIATMLIDAVVGVAAGGVVVLVVMIGKRLLGK